MTKERLSKLQEMSALIQKLEAVESQLENNRCTILITTGFGDGEYSPCSEMPVKLYPEFYTAFKWFIREQLKLVSSAFERA